MNTQIYVKKIKFTDYEAADTRCKNLLMNEYGSDVTLEEIYNSGFKRLKSIINISGNTATYILQTLKKYGFDFEVPVAKNNQSILYKNLCDKGIKALEEIQPENFKEDSNLYEKINATVVSYLDKMVKSRIKTATSKEELDMIENILEIQIKKYYQIVEYKRALLTNPKTRTVTIDKLNSAQKNEFYQTMQGKIAKISPSKTNLSYNDNQNNDFLNNSEL